MTQAIQIPKLGADPVAPFPAPERAVTDPDGLLAWGGDLSPERLLNAYSAGIFPWFGPHQPILWWCPESRAVIHPETVHISRRLRRLLRQNRYRVSADHCFAQVIQACAEPRGEDTETWITAEMLHAYNRLHELGKAHSIEVWDKRKLVGGLYGVCLGTLFFAESMFSRCSNTSKIALVTLCRQLQLAGFDLLDCQIPNPHLMSMGASLMERQEFCARVHAGVRQKAPISNWKKQFAKAISWC